MVGILDSRLELKKIWYTPVDTRTVPVPRRLPAFMACPSEPTTAQAIFWDSMPVIAMKFIWYVLPLLSYPMTGMFWSVKKGGTSRITHGQARTKSGGA